MSLILTESFEAAVGYTQNTRYLDTVFAGKWSHDTSSTTGAGSSNAYAYTLGRHGTFSGRGDNAQARYNHTVAASEEDTTFILGFARQYATTVTNQQYHVITRFLSDGGTTLHVTVYWDSVNKRFLVARGDSVFATGTVIYTGPSNQWQMDQSWHYFEVKCTLSATVGVVELRIDGVTTPIFSATGLNTKNGGTKTTLDTVQLAFMDSNTSIDDVYAVNTLGATNNDYLGDVVIEYLPMNNNGDVTAGVGSDGNQTDNYQLLNNWNDSTYIDFVTTGDEDLYNVADSSYAAPYAPAGVIVYARADKTDAGPRHFQIVAKGNGTTVNSGDKTPAWATFNSFQQAFDTRPDGQPWAFGDVNAAQFGVTATS